MRKLKSLLVLWVCVLGSCKEEDFTPISGARVSIPTIGVIDENGAEFSADVESFGVDPILEYGFVYGLSGRPDLSSDPKISVQGIPLNSFAMKAENDLINGRDYFVASFLKTAKTVFYSESVPFKSKGSKNFILQNVFSNEEVYFGDTVTIEAANLKESSLFLIKVKFEDVEVSVFDYSVEGFKFQIPKNFKFESRIFEDNDIRITVQIGDQIYAIPNTLKFKKPQFGARRSLDYMEEWEIRGKYFYSDVSQLQYLVDGNAHVFEITYSDDEIIRFRPNVHFAEKQPVFQVRLRNENHQTDQIEINESSLVSGQEFIEKSFQTKFEVEAKNINPYSIDLQLLKNSYPEAVHLTAKPTSTSRFDFSLEPIGPFPSRKLDFQLLNFESSSDIKFSYLYQNPALPIRDLSAVEGLNERVMALASGNKSYLLATNKIFEIDLAQGSFQQIQSFSEPEASQFGFAEEYNGKIYFSKFSPFSYLDPAPFYEFDPQTGAIRQLGTIPENGNLIGTFVVEGKLFFDLWNYKDGKMEYLRYTYDFAKNQWARTPGNNQFFVNNYADFTYGGKLYVLGLGPDNNSNLTFGLFSWNTATQQFQVEKTLNSGDYPQEEFQVAVKGDFAYYHLAGENIQFDIREGKIVKRSKFYPLEANTISSSNGELIILGRLSRTLLFQIEPEFFD